MDKVHNGVEGGGREIISPKKKKNYECYKEMLLFFKKMDFYAAENFTGEKIWSVSDKALQE